MPVGEGGCLIGAVLGWDEGPLMPPSLVSVTMGAFLSLTTHDIQSVTELIDPVSLNSSLFPTSLTSTALLAEVLITGSHALLQ